MGAVRDTLFFALFVFQRTLLDILSLSEKPVRWNAVPASKNGQALPEQRSNVQKCPVVCFQRHRIYQIQVSENDFHDTMRSP